MDKNELPGSVPLPNTLLFRDDVPPVVLRTFARLYALAWKHHYDRTDRLTTDELLVLLDLSMRPMYNHLAQLRKLGVLEWASDGNYGYIFTFPKSQGVPLSDDAPGEGVVTGAGKVGAWVPGAAVPGQDQSSGPTPSRQPGSVGISRQSAGAQTLIAENDSPTAEISSWSSGAQNPTVENDSPTAEISSWNSGAQIPTAENGSPTAEISSWSSGAQNPTVENDTPTAEISSWNSGAQNPTAENDSPAVEISSPVAEISSRKPSVVVVNNLDPDLNIDKQQQQGVSRSSPTAEINSSTAEISRPAASGLRPEPRGAGIRSWTELVNVLTAAGMWKDMAAGLTAGLDVSGVLDALGWIAAVRADRRVKNHGAVLVKQLQAGRYAPADWRPAAVCAACGVVDYRCTCGASERMVPAVYYTAAIEPVEEWGRDRWGVCQTCGRVACDGHNQAADDAAESEATYAASPNGAAVDLREAQIRQAWEDVEQLMRVRYATSVDLVGVVGNQAQITFAGKDRHQTMKLVQANFYRRLQRDVEVVDAGPT